MICLSKLLTPWSSCAEQGVAGQPNVGLQSYEKALAQKADVCLSLSHSLRLFILTHILSSLGLSCLAECLLILILSHLSSCEPLALIGEAR